MTFTDDASVKLNAGLKIEASIRNTHHIDRVNNSLLCTLEAAIVIAHFLIFSTSFTRFS